MFLGTFEPKVNSGCIQEFRGRERETQTDVAPNTAALDTWATANHHQLLHEALFDTTHYYTPHTGVPNQE